MKHQKHNNYKDTGTPITFKMSRGQNVTTPFCHKERVEVERHGKKTRVTKVISPTLIHNEVPAVMQNANSTSNLNEGMKEHNDKLTRPMETQAITDRKN